MSSATLWTNDYDTFVAKNKERLEKSFEEHYGETPFEQTGDEDALNEFYQLGDMKPVSIYMNLNDEDISKLKTIKVKTSINPPLPDWTHKVTAFAKNWAEWKKAFYALLNIK